jgi:hypothetical protein
MTRLFARSEKHPANVMPIIGELQAGGASSANAIAAKLNERRVPTARGGRWTHVQVAAVLARGNSASSVAHSAFRFAPSYRSEVSRSASSP